MDSLKLPGIDIVDLDYLDSKLLIYASMNGQLELVKYLIKEQGANIILDENKALRTAYCYGHLEIVKCLIENGADIHSFNGSALRYASGYGHLEVVKYLVEQGADIHYDDIIGGEYWSMYAADNGHLEIVKYMIKEYKLRKIIKLKSWKERQKFKRINYI